MIPVLEIPIARAPEAICFWLGRSVLRCRLPWCTTWNGHISASMRPTDLYDHSICSAKGRLNPLKAWNFGFSNQLPHKIVFLYPPRLPIYTQGYLVFESGRPQDYRQITTSFQRWWYTTCIEIQTFGQIYFGWLFAFGLFGQLKWRIKYIVV